MNSKPAAAGALVIGAGLLTGTLIIFVILLNPGNEIGQFFKFLLTALFAFGLIFPKAGLYTLVAVCGYFDVLKRLLVVADRVTFDDLTYVLGCPPALLGGVMLGLLVQWANGKRTMHAWNWICLVLVPAICTIVFLSNKLSGITLKNAAAETINAGFYAVLLVVIPLLFPTGPDLRKLLRFIAWVYVPVALYGMCQDIFGMSEFEITYLKTGLTILVDNLAMGDMRPFSTLNSPTALGAVCGMLAAICFLDLWHPPRAERTWGRQVLRALLGLVYVAGWFASTSRTDGIIVVLAPLAAVLFMSRIKTNALYFTLAGGFVVLVLTSEYILESVDHLQYFLWSFTGTSDSQFFNQMTRIGTYSDRLMGFSALVHDPRVWTLFGTTQMVKETIHYHDPLTSLLLDFGVVPLLAGIAVCIAVITRIHRNIWRIRDDSDRRLACAGVAAAMGVLAASLLGGNRVSVFPVGMFLWLMISVSVTLAWGQSRNAANEAAHEPVGKTEPRAHRGGRFRPVRSIPAGEAP